MTTPSDDKIRAAAGRVRKTVERFERFPMFESLGSDHMLIKSEEVAPFAADLRVLLEALSSPPEPIGGEASDDQVEAMARAYHTVLNQAAEEWAWTSLTAKARRTRVRAMRAALAVFPPPSTPEGEAVRVAISALERVEEDLVGIVGIGARQNVNRDASLMYEQAQASRDEVSKALLSVSSHLELVGAPQLTPGIARAHADMWLDMKKRAEAAETEVARLGAALTALRRSGEGV